ncbi:MAG: sulfatase-like hydrolase/transferase [Verrucomicrobiae bacterium]|nr:sulfatase-like hydrolase/transferase [Verrucomicrobiae bacterium]
MDGITGSDSKAPVTPCSIIRSSYGRMTRGSHSRRIGPTTSADRGLSEIGESNCRTRSWRKFCISSGARKGKKGFFYEGGIRVPMIARWPGQIHPAQTSRIPAAGWDLMATLAELAGVARPAHTDRISWVPSLLGQGDL